MNKIKFTVTLKSARHTKFFKLQASTIYNFTVFNTGKKKHRKTQEKANYDNAFSLI